ncbi:SMP-30/gluconolactonase/LRE family protein [Symbioplanes lichenis]|uniref:SMP-30/gluconolactonase/LRE family protein n=1 Tax=Symbioplanes lichenis TaxID=1629072 RepID=UPI0027387893|nr:SMP-30/gluconolactonase/LRE family protein [Actinoplanes lichenis]
MTLDVELVIDLHAQLGESPWWDQARQQLIFVDIVAGTLYRYGPLDDSLTAHEAGEPVGAALRRSAGGVVLALGSGLATWDEHGTPEMVCPIEADVPGNRLNDGTCDALGRLWVGSMAHDTTTGAGSLYCVEPDLSCRQVLRDVSISNGIGWNLDNTLMYYNDSKTGRVDVFDFDLGTGTLSGRRAFAELSAEDGEPDGLTVDAEGGVWIASFGGGTVRRYTPEGLLDLMIPVPARKVTSLAFGGADWDDLYITTAAIDLDAAEKARHPAAGGIFRCRPGVRGRPDFPFRG